MKKIFKGKVWKFGDCIDSGNIKGVMAGIDPEFHKKVQPGDVIVAGINFGMGRAPRTRQDHCVMPESPRYFLSLYQTSISEL